MENKYKELWIRAGVTLQINDGEASKILDSDASGTEIEPIIRKIIEEGRFRWDGSSYIPACCIADFNQKYGTDFNDTNGPEWSF